MPKEGRKQIKEALKQGKEEGKSLKDAEDFLRGLAEAEGASSEDIDAALERAGESALKCLKERKEQKEGEPATEGDDDAQAVALAQEDDEVADVVEEAVKAVGEMSESEKEELVRKLKEKKEQAGDKVTEALEKAMSEATGEQKAALRELVESLGGDDKPEGRQGKQ